MNEDQLNRIIKKEDTNHLQHEPCDIMVQSLLHMDHNTPCANEDYTFSQSDIIKQACIDIFKPDPCSDITVQLLPEIEHSELYTSEFYTFAQSGVIIDEETINVIKNEPSDIMVEPSPSTTNMEQIPLLVQNEYCINENDQISQLLIFKAENTEESTQETSDFAVHHVPHMKLDESCAVKENQCSLVKKPKKKSSKRTRTDEKPYSCKLCSKAFARRDTLKRHTNTHTGERPYTCKICLKTFPRSDTLASHLRTHIGEKLHPSA